MTQRVPEGTSRAVLSDVPDYIRLVDDIVDLEYVFIIDFSQLFVDQLLLGDVLQVSLALLHFSNGHGVVELAVEDAEDLR